MDKKDIEIKMHELEKIIWYKFNDINHLIDAMDTEKINIHKGENNKTYKNQTLAILGDAILRFVICEYFYKSSKEFIDKQKLNDLVEPKLADDYQYEMIQEKEIYKYAFNSGSTTISNSKKQPIYIESIIGAIYLDDGLESARNWILKMFIEEKWKDK